MSEKKRTRSAKSGKYVSKAEAELNPNETVTESAKTLKIILHYADGRRVAREIKQGRVFDLSGDEVGVEIERGAFKSNRANAPKGDTHPNSKLKAEQVKEIKRRLLNGERAASLGREYGVSRLTISGIKTGRAWAHLKID